MDLYAVSKAGERAKMWPNHARAAFFIIIFLIQNQKKTQTNEQANGSFILSTIYTIHCDLKCEINFKYCGYRIKHNILFVTGINYGPV